MFAIARETIDVRTVEESVRGEGFGGVVTFAGVVRADENGRAVEMLSYEAHEAMAVETFERIAGDLRARYGSLRVAIIHRAGDVAAGEVAVVVSVAAPHRREAFAACGEAVDELKRSAPIWKKERYRDGGEEWRENRE